MVLTEREAPPGGPGPGAVVEGRIERIAHGGEGVAHVEGLVVFVPWTAPGDRVRGEIVERHPRWARARLAEIVEPAEGRIVPGCPVFEVCGGCQLQHLPPAEQRAVKARAVADALFRIAQVEPPEPVECLPAAAPWGYRRRASLTWRWRDGRLALGYHAAALPRRWAEPGALVDIDACPILTAPGNVALAPLREALAAGLAGAAPCEGRLVIRAPDGVLEAGVFAPDPALAERLAAACAEGAGLAATWGRWTPGGPPVLARGAPRLERRIAIGGSSLRVGFDSFLQADPEAAERLYEAALEDVGPADGVRVIDAYAGIGALACRLADAGAEVTAVESHPGAASDLRANAAAAGEGRVHVLELPVERLDWRRPRPDTVIVNPPRAGCAPRAIDGLARSGARRLVYISCEPATLARDLRRLGSSWRLTRVRAFDMFPQTAHVETVARIER